MDHGLQQKCKQWKKKMVFIKCALSFPEICPIFKGLKRAQTLFLYKTIQGKREKGLGRGIE